MAKSILICDDAAFMRMMIKDILTKNACIPNKDGENIKGFAECIQAIKDILLIVEEILISFPWDQMIPFVKFIKNSI